MVHITNGKMPFNTSLKDIDFTGHGPDDPYELFNDQGLRYVIHEDQGDVTLTAEVDDYPASVVSDILPGVTEGVFDSTSAGHHYCDALQEWINAETPATADYDSAHVSFEDMLTWNVCVTFNKASEATIENGVDALSRAVHAIVSRTPQAVLDKLDAQLK